MPTDDAQERRALADLIEMEFIGVDPDDQGTVLEDRDWRLLVSALRATPDDREARVRAAEEMRERAAQVAEHPNAGLVPPDGGDPTPAEMLWNVAAAIRALSIPEAAPEDDGWRTMESAPRDGTEIILTDGVNVGSGFYSDAAESRRAGVEAGFFDECDRGNLLTARNTHATHWRPLPPPPSTLSTGPGGGDGR